MGEHKRPRLVGANGRPAAVEGKRDIVVDATPMTPAKALQLDITDLQGRIAEMTAVINLHHQALVELTASMQETERRSIRGRWRRLMIWLRLWVPTTPPDPAPRPDRDNPEAMPKS